MLNDDYRQQLHKIARDAIRYGLDNGSEMSINAADYDEPLRTRSATFVTLHKHDQLRGCIGILEPLRPLAEDVAHNAYAAAFSDRRFAPLRADEFDDLDIHISILGSPEELEFDNEAELINQLRPGVDGLIMQDGRNRGTFLPSVWEALPEAADFIKHLKHKAGLPANYWSDSLSVQRYTVEEF